MKSMMGVLAGLLLLVCTSSALAQNDADKNAELQRKYDKKLKKDFVSKVAWEKTFAAAKSKAAAENKLMLAYFTRSYAP